MVFAAVPKDVSIEKLTAPEKAALDEYLGKDTRKSILERLASNEKIPTLVAGGVILASAPTILKIIFDALAKQFPDKPEFDIEEAGVNYLTFTKDFAEALFDVTGSGKPFGFFEGEAEDFWSKYVTK
jgi:hypothetical protein